jgi:hypothetical protein
MDWLRSLRARSAGSPRFGRGAAICAITFAALLAGCGVTDAIGPTSCDRSVETNMPVLYTEGSVDGGIYMTSSWDGDPLEVPGGLLDFPGGKRYRIEHRLGAVPRFFQAYLSFNQYGIQDGTVALASGNQVEVDRVTCNSIDVINGSCVDYWLLFVASAGNVETDGEGGAGGAGGGDCAGDTGGAGAN